MVKLQAKTTIELQAIFLDGSATFANGDSTLNNVANGAAFNVRNNSNTQAIGVYAANFTSDERVISLNGDGSATFAGDLRSFNFNVGNASGVGFRCGNMNFTAQRPSTANDTDVVFNAYKGTTEKVRIQADGSASFANTVKFFDGTNTSMQLSPDGVQSIRASTSSTETCWRGYGGGTLTSQIFSDGSASFSNTVEASPDNFGGVKDAFSVKDPGDGLQKAVIKGDGSAEFAGNVQSNYQFNVLRNDSLAAIQVASGSSITGDTITARISADGSAEFAGVISSGTVSSSTFGQVSPGSIQARPAVFSDLTFVGYGTSQLLQFSVLMEMEVRVSPQELQELIPLVVSWLALLRT